MQDITTPEVQSATKTHGDSEKDLSDVTANYWSGHGNERIYINGLFTSSTDVFVDVADETVTVSGTKTRSSQVEETDDGISVTIKRPSSELVVAITEEADESDEAVAAEDDESDDSDVDLERFGVDI